LFIQCKWYYFDNLQSKTTKYWKTSTKI